MKEKSFSSTDVFGICLHQDSVYASQWIDNRTVLDPLHWSVFGFVATHDVLVSAALLPQFGDLLPQRRVLTLQESGSDCDLVLL